MAATKRQRTVTVRYDASDSDHRMLHRLIRVIVTTFLGHRHVRVIDQEVAEELGLPRLTGEVVEGGE